ncbi:MAG: cytochrome c-type biogenesis protein CcmH [Xanthomonadales bacterium]|nr:cytochrome c-type biogenesis protein CcmH [Xanthomonadales bacterium]NIT46225.1 cytochrome c-type biogenesis protein CcmH [Stutzerimonas stutzeri]NIN59905.1 cytochrome c-type biogenesis protein CcmH [Xanthomonadales bacterium]NIN75279.1 cytochrome c-type biogenesis protein CcmH [Xanthomonadales bacterium]NIO15148.1 cytochrome c-type biogenesis protein CcmH [Xanthomonadales bacterium]
MSRLPVLAALLLPLLAHGQLQVNQEPLVFDDPEQQARFTRLTEELRCLVCQNQNLADSDAPLAHDLRDEIFEMMQAGRSDEEIKQFLIERYGDFVLYRPPLKGNTMVLWVAPVLMLLVGAGVVGFSISRRRRLPDAAAGDAQTGDER